MRVAVIGGGVGGLAVAYNLAKTFREKGGAAPEICVLEAGSRFGGNAETMHFSFGTGPDGKQLRRWADLGVNDFNKTAYVEIDKVMDEIGFVEGRDYRPLEDSTSYYTGDGAVFFTDNAAPWWGTGVDPALKASVDSFMAIAGRDLHDDTYRDWSLEQYVTERPNSPGPDGKPIDWDPRLGPQVIYPRVNGMYFVSGETGARKMPFYAVMHYYHIQEGAGGAPARRMYFVEGASRWIDALSDYMTRHLGVRLKPGFRAEAARTAQGWRITNADDPAKTLDADLVVCATPANAALKLIRTLRPDVANSLAQIRYETAISVAHLDSRLLPADTNAWCTYNIRILEPGAAAMKPYAINYVANRHQNDANDPDYNRFGLPTFFVSINPPYPIPESMVLKDDDGREAVAYMQHNVFDFACIRAQAQIGARQGVDDLYFAGGWSYGSGLHEECWLQGIDIAEKLYSRITGRGDQPQAAADPHALLASRLRRTGDPSRREAPPERT